MITIRPLSMQCSMRISVKFTICRKKREIWFCHTRIVRRLYVSQSLGRQLLTLSLSVSLYAQSNPIFQPFRFNVHIKHSIAYLPSECISTLWQWRRWRRQQLIFRSNGPTEIVCTLCWLLLLLFRRPVSLTFFSCLHWDGSHVHRFHL